jgi:hypothetical protein
MKRLILFLMLASLTPAAFAQNDTLKNDKWNGVWDPNDPNCPCYAIQKQAEEEYRQMLEEEKRQKDLARRTDQDKNNNTVNNDGYSNPVNAADNQQQVVQDKTSDPVNVTAGTNSTQDNAVGDGAGTSTSADNNSSVSSSGSGGSGGSYGTTGKSKSFKKRFRKFMHKADKKVEKIFPARKKKRKLLDDCWH